MDNFAAFILTHGRPERVKTYRTLRKHGYTGRIVIVVDDEDAALDAYRANFGDQVVVFSKREAAKNTPSMENFEEMRSVVYARNASFKIAARLGLSHFVQLDDDYQAFEYRFDAKHRYWAVAQGSLDRVFASMVEALETMGASTITMAQGGDFIGGKENSSAASPRLTRKAMNSFVCATARPIQFIGVLNDDVNTYVHHGTRGGLFFMTNQVSLVQYKTQAAPGGLSMLYEETGTYVKSFYTVMLQPSSVWVQGMGATNIRLHHRTRWPHTVPMIIREEIRKERTDGRTKHKANA